MHFPLSLIDPATVGAIKSWFFHDQILSLFFFISFLILGVIVVFSFCKYFSPGLLDSFWLESTWTLLPTLILVILAIPSLSLLYNLDTPQTVSNDISQLKVVAHQWYWSYEYPLLKLSWDSFFDLENFSNRNLGSSLPLILFWKVNYNCLITSGDTLHSFAVPGSGLKCDAIPGRINQVFFTPLFVGLFKGQCSELCGVNHSFSPIEVEVMFFSNL